jgi:hypothetical protein
MRKRVFSSVLAACVALAGSTPAAVSAATPVVVELFTSQGCSSCPPADEFLGELSRRPHVVALAYHVDYWDELGWKDTFSIPAATQRQRGYVRKLSKSGAFTPQVVVSGDTSLVGSNRKDINAAIAADRDALAIALARTQSAVLITFSERWNEPMDVFAVSYLKQATTQIARGENARRSLTQFNVVRSFTRVGRWDGKPQTISVPLATFPPDATSIAVLLQRPGQGAIAGAATLALP